MIKIRKLYKNTLEEANADDPASQGKQTLSLSELAKIRKNRLRLEVFIELIEKGHEFLLVDGSQAVVDPNADDILIKLKELAKSGDITESMVKQIFGKRYIALPVILQSGERKDVSLSSFRKTRELGGEGVASRKQQEFAARGRLDLLIKEAIKSSGSDSITIKIKNDIIKGVIGVAEQPMVGGTDPKADFVIIRKDNLHPYYISHKFGSTPTDFGQWSGVTKRAGVQIAEHPDVALFVDKLKKSPYIVNNAIIRNVTVRDKSTMSEDLKHMAVFGPEYTQSGVGSPNNVDVIMQGTFELTSTDEPNVYELSANHILLRNGFDNNYGEGYMPIFIARAAERTAFGIKNTRISIYPEKGRVIRGFLEE